MESFISAIILGIVEGITEFLPVSSTGHLILVNKLVSFTGDFANIFDVVIQLGAILSVLVYFWHKLFPFGRNKTITEQREVWDLWKKTVIGVTPALLIGSALGKHVEELLFNQITVSIALVIGGIVLIMIEKRKKTTTINSIIDLNNKTAFMIGLIQCLAMIPGTSRSAATIIGAMLLGTSRSVAAEFSFFLAIPTMMAASAYSLLIKGGILNYFEWQLLITGFIVSFLVAWAVIAFFMKYIQGRDFIPFGYYRIIIGITVLTLSLS